MKKNMKKKKGENERKTNKEDSFKTETSSQINQGEDDQAGNRLK